jgi:hypothetical protein
MRRERKVESFEVAREVGAKLTDDFAKGNRIFTPRRVGTKIVLSFGEFDSSQTRIVGSQ